MKRLVNRWGRYFDVFVVFLVSGLWHGAAWTFVVWGALHASFIVVSLATKGWRTRALRASGLARFPRALGLWRVFVTFHLVCFAWIFFRAGSIGDALYVAGHLFGGLGPGAFGADLATRLGTPRKELLLAAALVALLELVQLAHSRLGAARLVAQRPVWVRWALYYSITAAILFLGEYQTQKFIYFQF